MASPRSPGSDLVLTGVSLRLPSAPEEGVTLSLALGAEEAEPTVSVPLTVSEDGLNAASSLRFATPCNEGMAALRFEVRARGAEDEQVTVMYASSSLEELGVGGACGAGGKLADVEMGEASLGCSWRLQRALPPLNKDHRCRPLAMRYSSSRTREEFSTREALWREEMHENQGKQNPVRGGSHRWAPAPPVQPSYLLGDERTQAQRLKHFMEANESNNLLSRQAAQVQLSQLQAAVSASVTAEQAVEALEAVRTFLGEGCNMAFIEPLDAIKHIKGLSLPFERLVRNVWVEGAEVAYDRAKESLVRLLRQKHAERKAEAEWSAHSDGYGPRRMVEELRHDFKLATAAHDAEPSQGVRVGLLTFKGQPLKQTRKHRASSEKSLS